MPASQHADTRGLKEIRARLTNNDEPTDTILDGPIGPGEAMPVTRAEYTSLCSRLSRMEAQLRQLARANRL